MPKNVIEYSIFIASPGDVQEEREILENVINELNLHIAKQYGITFQLIKWETHSYPSFGIDAQDVINKQINDDYDIFIGIMHSKFGSPTKREESGTYEEFQNAYLRWQQNPNKLKIMFYFKQGLVDISKIDTDQLKKVLEFQNEIKQKGGLYRTFDNGQQFAQLLRTNLTNIIPDLLEKNVTHKNELMETATITNDNNEILLEVGMYESIELSVDKLNETTESIFRMTNHTKELTEKINVRAGLLKRLSGASNEIKQREMRRIVDLLAGDYFDYSGRINAEIPIYRAKFSDAIKYLSNAHQIYEDWQREKENELIQAALKLKDSLRSTTQSNLEFKEAIKGIPGLTTKMIKAKKEVFGTLTKLDSEFNFSIQLIEENI